MIRILLFSTIALSLASSVLAFLTKEKAAVLSDKFAAAAQRAEALANENTKIKEENKTNTVKVDELKGSTEQQKQELEKAQATVTASEAEMMKIKSDLQGALAKAGDLEKKVAEMAAQPRVPVPDPATEQLVAGLRSDLEKAKQSVLEEHGKAEQKVRDLESKMSQMMPKPVAASAKSGDGKRPPTGQVVAYNEGWNFIVVNMGDKQGVTPESRLLVQRDGKVIAYLEITEVQPRFVTAGLKYPSGISAKGAKPEERVRPGDVVLFAPKVEPEGLPERGAFNASALFPKN
jgi:hypothetical protein